MKIKLINEFIEKIKKVYPDKDFIDLLDMAREIVVILIENK
ncbi:hypothetical protein [Helicovermis profundi]|uniref:Uncharacterized protein n=1 Tax=Helicovermis profundi TaxID=3065157 RepID=A0AAU9EAB5_9FIRM|nr:hypothetical protein HLPR_11280 [Clostridia bacterium S502]